MFATVPWFGEGVVSTVSFHARMLLLTHEISPQVLVDSIISFNPYALE